MNAVTVGKVRDIDATACQWLQSVLGRAPEGRPRNLANGSGSLLRPRGFLHRQFGH